MSEIGYTVESDFIERSVLTAKPGILVLSGLNATMKSIAARTLLIAGESEKGLFIPNFLTLGAKVNFIEHHSEIVSSAERGLISDVRLVTRAVLNFREDIFHIKNYLESLKSKHPEAEGYLWTLSKIMNGLGLGFIEELYNIKSKPPVEFIAKLNIELKGVIEEVTQKLKDEFETVEQAEVSVMPLLVTLTNPKELTVVIQDRRFKSEVSVNSVSTSIIAPLLFDYVTAFLAIPKDKVLVIEEPEESMTPLQQVVFSRYLERAVEKSMELTGKKAYVIITTHSPYIALSFSEKVPIKFFNYNASKRKIVIEDKPLKSFVMAEILIAAWASKSA